MSHAQVYIVDKVENNPITIAGHPAWATEYDTETNEIRAMDIITNSFCAGGNVLVSEHVLDGQLNSLVLKYLKLF